MLKKSLGGVSYRRLFDRVSELPVPLLPGGSWRRLRDVGAALAKLEVGPQEPGAGGFRERHLPLAKASLVRLLCKEAAVSTAGQQAGFQNLAASLDHALVGQFYGTLRELRDLFAPLNPDDDTPTNQMPRRARLDAEFDFLRRLAAVLEAGNFRELGSAQVARALSLHKSRAGVQVGVDLSKYDVLRVWVIGQTEAPKAAATGLLGRARSVLMSGGRRGGAGEPQLYQRLVLAVRLKQSDRLSVKMFKNVDASEIDMLLPEGTLVMSPLDRGIIFSTLSVGTGGALFASYAWKHHLTYIDYWGLVTGVSLLAAFRGTVTYKERKARHLAELAALVYHNCLAGNRPLLALLTDRAEDEAFKSALLAYCMLFAKPDGLTPLQLEQAAQDWAMAACGSAIEFDSDRPVELLTALGLVRVLPPAEQESGAKDSHSEADAPSPTAESRLVAMDIGQALGQLPSRPARSHLLLSDQCGDAFEQDRYALLIDVERRQVGWK
ncbi:hypothetical protein BOX15_Mlig033105g1 [Macrostomum lignano]|uniref:Chemotaxis protein n=2 Tax=Macrostomum lignano TaxID=282301 RepID=A0A1I8HXM1_9PLAT|nr:hypothetical protein BOX15_Mlig033105g1 [Macrostomum lignano]